MKTNEKYIDEIYEKYQKACKITYSTTIFKILSAFVLIPLLCITSVFAIMICKNYRNAKLTPSFTSNIQEHNIWVGTFQLAWNELMNMFNKPIEFDGNSPILVKELNNQNFTKDMLNESSYYITEGKISPEFKTQIQNDLKNKFNYNSEILNDINWNTSENEYLIYSILKKFFTFKIPFPEMNSKKFGDSNTKYKYFGLNSDTLDDTFDQVTVLFYNSASDFAIKIITLEGDEVILYRTNTLNSFSESYIELQRKANKFTGRTSMLRDKDELTVPFVKVNAIINYDELCNKIIKNSEQAYLKYAIQTVDFELTNYGGNLTSEAYIDICKLISENESEPRYFNFTDTFILYLKEQDKDLPYFSLLVDTPDMLVEQ